MNRKASPWCKLRALQGDPTDEVLWCADRPARPVFCDNFWQYFDWEQPKPGERMRIVFSRDPVEGAQKSVFWRDRFDWKLPLPDRFIKLFGQRTRMTGQHLRFHNEIDELIEGLVPDFDGDELHDNGLALWWWPEYR